MKMYKGEQRKEIGKIIDKINKKDELLIFNFSDLKETEREYTYEISSEELRKIFKKKFVGSDVEKISFSLISHLKKRFELNKNSFNY
jgi:hypothetical protein